MADKIDFTKAKIDVLRMPEPSKRETYHDTKTEGLQLSVTSTGVMKIVVNFLIIGATW
jgi:hypothetical protein